MKNKTKQKKPYQHDIALSFPVYHSSSTDQDMSLHLHPVLTLGRFPLPFFELELFLYPVPFCLSFS